MTTKTTLLITKDPSHPLAYVALRYAKALLNETDENKKPALQLFFYADSAHLANRLRWQSADQLDLTQQWQALARKHELALPVCVSTALSRGVSDSENSARHQLTGDNLADGFTLVGLSELAMMLQDDNRLIAF
ncbi:sulfurtransferase complex subunit TusD [Psychrobacter sp. Ps3]|uniref:sulfurtransferase complex subunit TusD n=1 Tax=Psychrobacter sp. Ps3 TaxID=2790957 RepID=UPI001EDF57DC|nr:sulfurtransferase complex subunit TusD [Psychrobacter sp. Ps3]MCG3882452.1 sulfurtransferase complex subunit TusD [Psychrobacter sp. Ps3]